MSLRPSRPRRQPADAAAAFSAVLADLSRQVRAWSDSGFSESAYRRVAATLDRLPADRELPRRLPGELSADQVSGLHRGRLPGGSLLLLDVDGYWWVVPAGMRSQVAGLGPFARAFTLPAS